MIFLDLSSVVSSGGERGLLGLAFAPDALDGGRFFVDFTDANGNTVVARFRRSAGDPLLADVASRFDLRWNGPAGPAWIAQPFANHNGGHLAFGPDGLLYVGLGDGGSGGDPGDYAQNPSELLGKMLRIDVNVPDDDPSGYVVPPSNPFQPRTHPGYRPGSGRSVSGIHGVTRLMMSCVAAQAPSSSPMSVRTRGRRLTTNRAGAGGATTAGGTVKGPTTTTVRTSRRSCL